MCIRDRFEGVYPILWRRLADKDGDVKQLDDYFEVKECPDCRGERLCELSRSVTVQGLRLPQLSLFSLDRLYAWVREDVYKRQAICNQAQTVYAAVPFV